MDIQLANSKSKVSVSDAVFGADYNEALVHQVVVAWMNGARGLLPSRRPSYLRAVASHVPTTLEV